TGGDREGGDADCPELLDVGADRRGEQDEAAEAPGERGETRVPRDRVEDVARGERASGPADEDAGAIAHERGDALFDLVEGALEKGGLDGAWSVPVGLTVAGRVARGADEPPAVAASAPEPVAHRRGLHARRVEH